MALTGKLGADFAAFYEAVTKAEVHLKSFETGASKVEGSLNRMVDSFSGRKIMSEATIAVEAVERIGGASKLTEAEQRKVNATVTEAIAKYAALGQAAPPAMVALAAATKQTEVATAGLSTSMVALGSFIGTMAANAVTALTRMAAEGLKAVAKGIVELVMEGPRLAGIENSFQALSKSVNETGAAMLGAMRTGTRNLVADMDLMTIANKAILLGLPVTAKEMGGLSESAITLGRAMGLSATVSIDNLVTALGRSSPLILDNLGLSVKVGEANEAYAKKLGRTAASLTEAEQKTAFYNAAMEAANVRLAELGSGHDSLGDSIKRAGVWWDNFKNDLSIAIARSPVLSAGMTTLGASFSTAFGPDRAALVQTLSGYVSRFGITAVDAADATIDAMRLVVTSFLSVRAAVFELASIYTVKVREMIDQTLAIVAAGRLFTQFMTPFGGDLSGFDKVILKLGEIRTQLGGVGSSFVDTANDALNATGHWNAGLDSAQKTLGAARAAMVAAMVATTTLTGATHELTGATKGATVAVEEATVATEGLGKAGVVMGDFLVEAMEETETAAKSMGDTFVEQYGRAQRAAEELAETQAEARAAERKAQLESRLLPTSFDVTSQNFGQTLEGIITSFGMNPSGRGSAINASEAYALARLGYSFQEILDIFNRRQAGGTGTIPPPQGPRIPGFAGGVENFGGGLARVHAGELLVNLPRGTSVVPAGRGAGGVNVVINVGTVLSSKQELARYVQQAMVDLARAQGHRMGN